MHQPERRLFDTEQPQLRRGPKTIIEPLWPLQIELRGGGDEGPRSDFMLIDGGSTRTFDVSED
jgi:hypothetical protein